MARASAASAATTLGPTNLTLNVGGNLLLGGGTVNGPPWSSGASTQANTITVTAAATSRWSRWAAAAHRQLRPGPGHPGQHLA